MRWSDIPFSPPDRTLRQFAGLWLLVFGAFASRQALTQGPSPWTAALAGLALGVGVAGLSRPRLVRPVFVAATVLTFPIGWAVSRLSLACLYYGAITPLGLALRLTGHDPLELRRGPGQRTYWEPRPEGDAGRYLRQF
jgi:hypothetical protein